MDAFKYRSIDFRVATTPEDLSQVTGLCAKVYHDEFGGEPVGSKVFNAKSIHLGAWHNGCVIGTLRCVPDGPLGLPMEHASGVRCDSWRERGKICEMGRFAVERDNAASPFALMGLLRLSIWYVMENDVTWLLICAPQRIWPLYRRMQMTSFGEPFSHPAGEPFVLGVMDLGAALLRANQELERGMNSNFLHEILESLSATEREMMQSYLSRRRS
jgi:hypothetical protein